MGWGRNSGIVWPEFLMYRKHELKFLPVQCSSYTKSFLSAQLGRYVCSGFYAQLRGL